MEEKLVKHLMERLSLCETNLRDSCADHSEDYRELLHTKREDLPTLINEPSPLGKWASERLKDSKWNTPECWIEFLSNEEFSYGQYRSLGINDGELQSIAGIFNLLGMDKEAERAFACMYSE